jgi:hypothetical protein
MPEGWTQRKCKGKAEKKKRGSRGRAEKRRENRENREGLVDDLVYFTPYSIS